MQMNRIRALGMALNSAGLAIWVVSLWAVCSLCEKGIHWPLLWWMWVLVGAGHLLISIGAILRVFDE